MTLLKTVLILIFSFSLGYVKAQVMTAKEMTQSITSLNKEVVDLKKYLSKPAVRKKIKTQKYILEVDEVEEAYIGFSYDQLPKNNRLINGSLISMSRNGQGYEISQDLHDKKVIGILTENVTEKTNKKFYHIVFSGRVRVRVGCPVGENCKIEVGDLLVPSDEWGVATKCKDYNQCAGSIIGKALEPYNNRSREGFIMALIMLR